MKSMGMISECCCKEVYYKNEKRFKNEQINRDDATKKELIQVE